MPSLLSEAFGDIKPKQKVNSELNRYTSKNMLQNFKPLDYNFNEYSGVMGNIQENNFKDYEQTKNNEFTQPIQEFSAKQPIPEPIEQPSPQELYPNNPPKNEVIQEKPIESTPVEKTSNVSISNKEYRDFINYQKQRHQDTTQKRFDHRSIENFGNFNDNFNDVLLFIIFGILYIMIIDYIYRFGKKSF